MDSIQNRQKPKVGRSQTGRDTAGGMGSGCNWKLYRAACHLLAIFFGVTTAPIPLSSRRYAQGQREEKKYQVIGNEGKGKKGKGSRRQNHAKNERETHEAEGRCCTSETKSRRGEKNAQAERGKGNTSPSNAAHSGGVSGTAVVLPYY